MLLLLFAACQLDIGRDGTAVGNPTGMSVQTASATALTWKSATGTAERVTVTDCAGGVRETNLDATVDLLGGVVEVPAGTWCSVELRFTGPIELQAEAADTSSATLRLDVRRVRLTRTQGLVSDASPWVLELASPGWTSAADLGATGGAAVVIDAGDPRHDLLVEAIETGSALFEDRDDDGEVDDDERDGRLDDDDDDDTGDDDGSGGDDSGDDDSGDDDSGADG